MGGAAGDDHQVPVARGRPAAVAVRDTTLHLVHVQHGGAHPQRRTLAQPEGGADPWTEREVGVGGAQLVELSPGEVADVDGAGGQAGRDQVVDEPGHLGEVRGDVQGQVQRHAAQPAGAGAFQPLRGTGEVASGHPVTPHRSELFEHETGGGVLVE